MDGDDLGQLGHPIQRTDYDLDVEPRKAENSPTLPHDPNAYRSPAALMRAMGFDPSKSMSPLQFMLAVMNDDCEAIFKDKKRLERYKSKGGLAMSYRIECAKAAAKYMHEEAPKIQVNKNEGGTFIKDLQDGFTAANERVTRRTFILEEVERISPKMPLPPTNLSSAFEDIDGEASRVYEDQEEYSGPDVQRPAPVIDENEFAYQEDDDEFSHP